MNQIFTDAEYDSICQSCDRPSDFAKAIERAILNKLNSAEPIFQVWRSTDGFNEFYAWRDCERSEFDNSPERDRRALYTAPSAVTCQIYGHVVGACDECNTHAENDVNETNKILADNYLKLTCGNPAPSASSRHFKQMESQLAQLTSERDSLKATLDAVAKVASDAEKLVISQRDEIAKLEADRDSLKSALESLLKVAPTEVSCNNMSHPRKYQHRYDETCELVSIYAEALLTAQEALKGLKCKN